MARVIRLTTDPLKDKEKAQHFHRAMELNFTVGSECLRGLTQKYLKVKGVTLKEHLADQQVQQILQKLHLFQDQKQKLNDTDTQLISMDVTLLQILLLKTFPLQITPSDEGCIQTINQKRTQLAHLPFGRLEDDTLFKEYSQSILILSKSVGNEYNRNMVNIINDLRRRELVSTCSDMDRIRINNEVFMLKLVEANNTSEDDQDRELLIKVGLTRWVRKLSVGLEVPDFLNLLKTEGVISDTQKRTFEVEYSYESQMRSLVLHLINTRTKDDIYKMCHCLRKVSPLLADLVEGSDTDGREIERYLSSKAKTKIRDVLHDAIEVKENESITAEDVHIFVETKLRERFDFSFIRKCVLKQFPEARNTQEDSSFYGVSWKRHLATEISNIGSVTDEEEEHADVHAMSCEEFANYTRNVFQKRRPSLGEQLKEAVFEESISASTFVVMTNEQLKRTFSPYLHPIKYGFGIEMDLQHIQRTIKDAASHAPVTLSQEKDLVMLRSFEKPVEKVHYKLGIVRPARGNLLIPQHEFIYLPSDKMYNIHTIVREVIRFADACINGRKNGTIHFGIHPFQNGIGRVIGITVNRCLQDQLDDEIDRSLNTCFEQNVSVAKRCIRPAQIIPVDGDKIVIEVDIVPYSIHIPTDLLPVRYPPKGYQRQTYFIFDGKEILPVSQSKLNAVCAAYANVLKEREYLEKEKSVDEKTVNSKQRKLKELLTRGNKYVTDELLPVMVLGRISGSQRETEIRKALDIDRAVTSCELVLDFDSSVELRNKVEEDKTSFLIKTAENVSQSAKSKSETFDQSEYLPVWLYCNGNEDLETVAFGLPEWMRSRAEGVKKALGQLRKTIPKDRGLLIFLIFDAPSQYQDPLFEIARDALVSSYRDECIVISDKEENITYLKREVTRVFDESTADDCFITGLEWSEISRVMNTVFRVSADVICKLPCSKGHFVEMTLKEKDELKFTDIEILSGEQCIHDEQLMPGEERRTKCRESQEKFYKGEAVTWWNFYYETQVSKRALFDKHKNDIKEKLSNEKGEGLIDVQVIEHHPGAGGSTLGRHLIWNFSQFRGNPDTAYRCLVVNTITDETVNQIDRFRTFKDEDDTRPFLILIDNKSEEDVLLLRTKLHELAYKTATPGKLFCLIIIVSRMSITYVQTKGKPLLKHELTTTEQNWFENKYKEMEQRGDIDVTTLLAFNIMRKSFDQKYIQDTTSRLMQGISKKELDVLKCLSLISTYESDHPVPQSVFDTMMNDQIDTDLILRQPFGIAHHMKEMSKLAKFSRKTWNVQMTDAMRLLLTKREHETLYCSGVCIVSQLLARAVLDYIMKNEGMSLENIVHYVLDLVEDQSKTENTMSKKFVKIVCSLFKTRQLIDSEKGDAKLKFSDLILELERSVESEEGIDARKRVLEVVQRCFYITDDAMVGQQLARFNIHIKEFAAAEEAVQRSLHLRPDSSYLLDTYGQIFKTRMEFLFESCPRSESKIPDGSAAEIIIQALKAVEKFREGQLLAIRYDEDTNWSCFHMEVKTTLNLLEKFSKFSCYVDRENFLHFLNEPDFMIERSSFAEIMEACPQLNSIRSGREFQQHVDTSLRSLEERFYQVKGHLYTIFTENEALLLKLRERFERYYGSPGKTVHFKFLYGIGLKPLQQAKEKDPGILERRVKEADENLQRIRGSNADVRDLLIYLGTRIITLSNQGDSERKCDVGDYKTLLLYSSILVEKQMSVKTSERSYLESFLYFAMLHWPLKNRIELNLEELSGPKMYTKCMTQWESAFNNNFFLKTMDQIRKHKPKNYFVLAKGSPGNDILDLESIRKKWVEKKKDTGRLRKPVYRDNFWKENFVVERLERLDGVMDGSGGQIIHTVEYPQHGTHKFRINTYYPCAALSNRAVTFVLGFTWKGPTALDVDEKGKNGAHQRVDYYDDGPSSIETADNGDDVEVTPLEPTGVTPADGDGNADETRPTDHRETLTSLQREKEHQSSDRDTGTGNVATGISATDGATGSHKGNTVRPVWMKSKKKKRHRKK